MDVQLSDMFKDVNVKQGDLHETCREMLEVTAEMTGVTKMSGHLSCKVGTGHIVYTHPDYGSRLLLHTEFESKGAIVSWSFAKGTAWVAVSQGSDPHDVLDKFQEMCVNIVVHHRGITPKVLLTGENEWMVHVIDAVANATVKKYSPDIWFLTLYDTVKGYSARSTLTLGECTRSYTDSDVSCDPVLAIEWDGTTLNITMSTDGVIRYKELTDITLSAIRAMAEEIPKMGDAV